MMIIRKGTVSFILVLLCSFVSVASALGPSTHKVAKSGDIFPPYIFPPPTSSQDRSYLGLSEENPFTIGDIQADLILLELLTIYCTSCQKQAPIFNEVFNRVKRDPAMTDRVKLMGVGLGNNEREMEFFRKEKNILFPMLPDVHFDLYRAIGGSGGVRTPLTLLIRKDKKGRGIVIHSHMGMIHEKEEILDEIKAALQYDLTYLRIEKGERMVLPPMEKLKPPLSDEDLLKKLKEGMVLPEGVVEEIRRISPHHEYLYAGKVKIKGQEKYLFAKVVSWPPLCNICHDIHFIYVFDEKGKIINLIPIHLPKGNNKAWDQEDIEKMKNRLIGRSLLKNLEFNRDVDAISGATITSVIIFHRLNEGKEVYNRLVKQGYVK